MSTASAPISIASAISPIMSPACVPTMPPPTMAVRRLVEEQLGEALVAAVGDRAARRRPREQALLHLDAARLRLVLGDADPGDLGIGVGDARDHARVERRLRQLASPSCSPAATSAATCASCTALCSSIGWPTMSPTAKMCGTLVRIWMSTGMKPRSSTLTPAASAPMRLPLGRGRRLAGRGRRPAPSARPRLRTRRRCRRTRLRARRSSSSAGCCRSAARCASAGP